MPKRTRLQLIAAFCLGVTLTVVCFNTDLVSMVTTAYADKALYPDRDWNRGAPSKLNISVFVYADNNRNGTYDLGEKPLAGIAVRLSRPDGSTRIVRSNVNGYTNFGMHLNSKDADINQANALYRFDVVTPPDWINTSDNVRQETTFRAIKGAIAGMGATHPPAPVGLAPPAEVRGTLSEGLAGTRIIADKALATEAGENRDSPASIQTTSGRDGSYTLRLTPGEWTLRFLPGSEARAPWSRDVKLTYSPVTLSAISAGSDRSSSSDIKEEQVVVDFDDLTRSFIDKLGSGYAGLDWDYLLAVDNQFYKGPGYVNALRSGSNVAYNSSGHPVTISARDRYFDFVGGYFAAAWPSAEGELLLVRAWRDKDIVMEDEVRLSHLAPIYYQADLHRISKLELKTQHYTQFVADDLEFRR